MKICAKCPYFVSKGEAWYDHHCGHPLVQRVKGIHPQTGKETYWATNSLGERYHTEKGMPYARDINPSGKCEYRNKETTGEPPTTLEIAVGRRMK